MHHDPSLASTAPSRHLDRSSSRAGPAAALAGVLLLGLGPGAGAGTIDFSNVDWSVYALIDNSETLVIGGVSVDQSDRPRDVRGLEISAAGDFLYAGYNNPSTGFEVRRLDLSQSGNAAYVNRVAGLRGKAIATDDMGRVYLAEGDRIEIRSADLSTSLGSVTGLTKSEGVAVARDSGGLALYVTDRTGEDLTKFRLDEGPGNTITGHSADTGFGTLGTGKVPLGRDPRGVTVDSDGRIWVAGRGNHTLYRVSADGTTVATTAVDDPFDVAAVEDTVLITRELDVVVHDAVSLLELDVLDIMWAALGLDGGGSLGGIAIDPTMGLYVANEDGETAPVPGVEDDNDPILLASFRQLAVAEPGVLVLMSLGLLALGTGRRTSRKPARASLVSC